MHVNVYLGVVDDKFRFLSLYSTHKDDILHSFIQLVMILTVEIVNIVVKCYGYCIQLFLSID